MRILMPRHVSLAYLLLFLVFIGIAGLSTPATLEGNEASFVVRVKDDLLTVDASEIPLKKLLAEIAGQTALKVTCFVPASKPISANFSDIPMEEALRRLTRDYNTVFIFGPEKGRIKGPGIEEVIIYAKTDKGSDRNYRGRTFVPRGAGTPPLGVPSTTSRFGVRGKDRMENISKVEVKAPDIPGEPEGHPDIVRLGKVLVRNNSSEEKAQAAEALGELGDEMALVPLIEALRDKNSLVRDRAVDALCDIGGENVVRALRGCLSDRDKDVRRLASEALERIKKEQ